jgi:hypothetical protein
LRGNAGFAQNVADQACRGRFPIRACDTDVAALQEGRGEFDFADHFGATRPHGLERREIGRHIGREDD